MSLCPFCKCKGSFFFGSIQTNYDFCKYCGLIYRKSRASNDEIHKSYIKDYFPIYSQDQTKFKRERLHTALLNQIEKKKLPDQLLDVGAGCGFFLRHAKERRWTVIGIDPSDQSIKFAEIHGVEVIRGVFEDVFFNDHFDAITFINVLDHMPEPWKAVSKAFGLLKNNGIIFIRFPNGLLHSSMLRIASKFGLSKHIQKYLVFHQYSFTPTFIAKLLSEKGFSEVLIQNSPPSSGDPNKLFGADIFGEIIKRATFFLSQLAYIISGKKFLIGASLYAIATKKES